MDPREILKRLGAGERIVDVCGANADSETFQRWWREEATRRVPTRQGELRLPGTSAAVRLDRDRLGIPHIHAHDEHDLFVAFGYATAQDRLFQLDYLRRRASGRLAEVLGKEAVESDVLYRTLDLPGIARRELESFPAETRQALDAYTAGINALIDETRDMPPIEFDLLDYRPEPWKPEDSLALVGEFRWYLTGRFPVIVIPELAKRALKDERLYRAFLLGEDDAEGVLFPGEYWAGPDAAGLPGHDPSGAGSNNWVVAGSRTSTGKPIVANDPHVPFNAVSIWHQVVLHGGRYHVAGVAYAGMPAVMIGRTREVAWGITNNICSLRDLYQEKTDAAHPGCFLFDGRWEPEKRRDEVIQVRGGEPVRKTIRSSRHGPIVDEILPAAARDTLPVSLRWLGQEPCGWLTALLGMNRAVSAAEFREAARPWRVPTFNIVYADQAGHFGMQCVGRIPIRAIAERGYRPGWDPRHVWQRLFRFEDMPHVEDPPRGFVVTANNRVAPDDFQPPLSGTWSSGHRARRIRTTIEAKKPWTVADCAKLHQDVYSGRAAECVPLLLGHLGGGDNLQSAQAIERLREWDFRATADSVAAAIFNVFFVHWSRAVAAERFPAVQASFVSANVGGLASRLLAGDYVDWFTKRSLGDAVRDAFRAALDELATRLGPDVSEWRWGRLHVLLQKHPLSSRGDLGQLLDRSGAPIGGDGTTVNSATPDVSHAAWLGATYRMIADLADPSMGLTQIEVGSVSGHPGSSHYDDQLAAWWRGEYHSLSLNVNDG